jgi:hypothetical protein
VFAGSPADAGRGCGVGAIAALAAGAADCGDGAGGQGDDCAARVGTRSLAFDGLDEGDWLAAIASDATLRELPATAATAGALTDSMDDRSAAPCGLSAATAAGR